MTTSTGSSSQSPQQRAIEAFVWLTDIARLTTAEALAIMRFTAQTLLAAAGA